jgi:hypothetical protein
LRTYNTRNQEITALAAKVIQLERLLRRYGPEADGERDLLHRYTAIVVTKPKKAREPGKS